MNIYVIRNNQRFGPYDERLLLAYVNKGLVLKHDRAISDGDVLERTVGYYLKKVNLSRDISVENKGNFVEQLSSIGSELIFPRTSLCSKNFIFDTRFIILAVVGLLPMVIMNIPLGGFFIFYEVALYFSIIWGLFFYSCFKTSQVKIKNTMYVFFFMQVFVFLIWDVFGVPRFNPFYILTDTLFPLNVAGYIFGVGLTEELAKMLPLIIILRKAKELIRQECILLS